MTELGKAQARENGEWLMNYCRNKNIDISNARIWRSPYLRTRQTCDEFNKYLDIADIREDITLTEQQFGLFDSVPEEDWGKLYPTEFAEYERQRSNYGKFYARLPLGESPFDVAIRVHQFMGTIHRDFEKHGVDTLFMVRRCFGQSFVLMLNNIIDLEKADVIGAIHRYENGCVIILSVITRMMWRSRKAARKMQFVRPM